MLACYKKKTYSGAHSRVATLTTSFQKKNNTTLSQQIIKKKPPRSCLIRARFQCHFFTPIQFFLQVPASTEDVFCTSKSHFIFFVVWIPMKCFPRLSPEEVVSPRPLINISRFQPGFALTFGFFFFFFCETLPPTDIFFFKKRNVGCIHLRYPFNVQWNKTSEEGPTLSLPERSCV